MTKNNTFENGLTVDGVTKIIDKLEQSSFNFLELNSDNINLVIGKEGYVPSTNGAVAEAPAIERPVESTPVQEVAPTAEPVVEEAPIPVAKPSKVGEEDGVHVVKASTAGIFFAQSEPGAPPYVKIGDQVEEDTTVGLLEIMKVYSAITAGVSGKITSIHVEDAELIEYGQPLFSVKISE